MTTALEWGEGSASRPGRSLPRESPIIHCTGGWVGPRPGLERCGKSRPPPGFDPRTVQPVASRSSDWATRPTNTSMLLGNSPWHIIPTVSGWVRRDWGLIQRYLGLLTSSKEALHSCTTVYWTRSIVINITDDVNVSILKIRNRFFLLFFRKQNSNNEVINGG